MEIIKNLQKLSISVLSDALDQLGVGGGDVEMGVILTISDSLADLEWNPKFHLEKVKKQLGIIYKVAIDVLTN